MSWVPSVEPVSTTTISSTCGRARLRHCSSPSASFFTIIQSESLGPVALFRYLRFGLLISTGLYHPIGRRTIFSVRLIAHVVPNYRVSLDRGRRKTYPPFPAAVFT